MDAEKLKSLVVGAAFEEDGRKKLSCAKAFALAEKHGIKLMDISRICNKEGIRICGCQLGCFK